ncbi:hypothetical protein HHI36_010487 [Cryptolaemus montrouzieri]|uniref:Uncharacterized protein n=1 Tax=Cryptolaemus montrouzieri TaxID=559131 RepID=A0ABD2MIY5_9CUCU
MHEIITADILILDINVILKVILQLFNNIWIEVKFSKDWKEGVIDKFTEKDDGSRWTMTISNFSCRLFSSFIIGEQYRFRPGYFFTDNIHTIRIALAYSYVDLFYSYC